MGISGPVIPLVMGKHDVGYFCGNAVADQLVAHHGMTAKLFPFGGIERTRLVEDAARNKDLADVVQESCELEPLDTITRKAHCLGDIPGQTTSALTVSRQLRISGADKPFESMHGGPSEVFYHCRRVDRIFEWAVRINYTRVTQTSQVGARRQCSVGGVA